MTYFLTFNFPPGGTKGWRIHYLPKLLPKCYWDIIYKRIQLGLVLKIPIQHENNTKKREINSIGLPSEGTCFIKKTWYVFEVVYWLLSKDQLDALRRLLWTSWQCCICFSCFSRCSKPWWRKGKVSRARHVVCPLNCDRYLSFTLTSME